MRILRRSSAVVATALLLFGPAGLTAARGDGTPPPGGERAGADPDYTAGVKAIEAEQFAAAIPLLERAVARDALSADAHNWLAYAVRRSGDPARSIPIYQKALALDPQHRGAHEYIGEAYLMLGNLAKAREHLARLNSLCFLPCSEYTDLKKAVEQHEKRGKTSTTR